MAARRDERGAGIAPRRAVRLGRWSRWLLPVVVWLGATLFLGGDLGRWSDDYAFVLRDQATGLWERLVPSGATTFFRPLHMRLIYAVNTLLWFHPRLIHLLLAVLHGVAALLLWRLLRRLGRSRAASAGFAMLFLVAPAHHEVVFWFSAASIGIATSLLLLSFLTFVAFARGRTGLASLPILAALGFAIPCFNEQPAAPLLALPVLALAALPRHLGPGDVAARAAAGCAAMAAGPALYLHLLLTTAAPTDRGGPGTFVGAAELSARLGEVAEQVRATLVQASFRSGASLAGREEIVSHPLLATAFLLALLLAGLPWAARSLRRSTWTAPASDARRELATVLFGITAFLAAWLPVLAIRGQDVPPRLAYAPLVGLAVAGAALLDAVALRACGPTRGRRPLRALAAAAGGALLLYGLVLMIGVQALYFRRARLDEREAEALVALLPDPAPGTLVLPLAAESRASATGSPAFDDALAGPLSFTWSAPYFVRWAYRRSDLFAAGARGPQPLVVDADERGLHVSDVGIAPTPFARSAAGFFVVPWHLVAPILVGRDGSVRLVTQVAVRAADGSERAFRPAQTAAAARRGRLPEVAVTMP